MEGLKAAALTVKLEESADNLEAFTDAANEIGEKHGLDSPSKHKRKGLGVDAFVHDVEQSVDRLAEINDPARGEITRTLSKISTDGGATDNNTSPTVDDAVAALADQMGVELKTPTSPANPAVNGDEAVDRLMAPQTDAEFNENIVQHRKKNVKFGDANRDQMRYLNMRKSMDNRNNSPGLGPGGSNKVVITRRSKVSKMIRSTDDNYGRSSQHFKSDSQELMFREMKLVEDKSAKKKKVRKVVVKEKQAERISQRLSTQTLQAHQGPSAYEILTQSRRHKNIDQREKVYSRYEDAKECTFRPRIRKNAYSEDAAPDDDDRKAPKKDMFVERQEAAERGRVSKLELNIGKQEYDALLDKKFCPQCKGKQSYDDIKEKRKKCSNCNIEYTTRIEWNKVKKDFFERQQGTLDYIDKRRKAREETLLQETRRGTKTVYDKKKGHLVVQEVDYTATSTKWDEDMEHDFFTRKEKMEQKRQMHLKQIEDEMYGEIGSKSLSALDFENKDFNLYDSGRSGSKLFGLDAATAFLHRYEEDVKRRNAIKAALWEEEMAKKHLMDRTVQDNLCEHPQPFH